MFIVSCTALGALVYLALEYGLPLTPLRPGAHELAVFLGFLVVPLCVLVLTRRRPELGGLDRGFFAGIGLYLLFTIPLLMLIPGNPGFFKGYRMAAPAMASWAFLTLLQVPTIDFFTKRIVQLEATRSWGAGKGMLVQFVAWCGAHIVEYGWLKELAGPAGAVLFLGVTGALTGALYWRTKNVAGMMAGHWILNLVLAAAAVVYYHA